MTRLLLIGLAIIASGFGLVAFASADAFAADAKQQVCQGVGTVSGTGDCSAGNGPDFNSVVRTVLNILSALAGLVAVFMFMWGGFKYITSGGDSSKVSSAKGTLLYAIIGVVIVVFSQVIVQFVVNKATEKPKTGYSSSIQSA